MLQLAAVFISGWVACEVYRFIMSMNQSNETVPASCQQESPRGKGKPNDPTKPSNTAVLSRRQAGANWQKANVLGKSSTENKKQKKDKKFTKYVAMDCEMVGIGPTGRDDMVARVSIVNQHGEVLLDKYVKPTEEVTDYRTKVSGIRPHNIEHGEQFENVQNEVINLLKDKVLVGHSVSTDLAVLAIKHPSKLIRDTAKYRPLAKAVSNGSTPSLKKLSKVILGVDIQNGEHNSVEDARATMAVYNRISGDWEKNIKKAINRANRAGRGRT